MSSEGSRICRVVSLFWIIKCLLLFFLVVETEAKGATKVRAPTGQRNTNRQKSRASPVSASSVSGSGSTSGYSSDNQQLARLPHRNLSHEERLLTHLFREYDPVARAVIDVSKPVNVIIDFVLLRIHGLEERSQVLTTTGLVIAEWTDERLTWEPSHFGNLTDMIVRADKIWLPELAVMNGADELMPDFERIRVLLHSDGRLHWEPGGIFRTTCDINIAYFPFDAQHCPLLIGAYSYYSTRMNITNASDSVSTHDFRINGEWHVYGTGARYAITHLDCCSGNGYAHVVFMLHLKRRYKFYIMNIVLPCVMLSVLIMIGFCLPPEAGEKISLGISVLLAFTVFLLMIADNIPRTSSAIPLIVTYLMTTMTLGTVSICITVLILNVHHRGARHRVSPLLRTVFLVYVARAICVQTSYDRSPTRPSPRSRSAAGDDSDTPDGDEDEPIWKRRRHRLPYDDLHHRHRQGRSGNHDLRRSLYKDTTAGYSPRERPHEKDRGKGPNQPAEARKVPLQGSLDDSELGIAVTRLDLVGLPRPASAGIIDSVPNGRTGSPRRGVASAPARGKARVTAFRRSLSKTIQRVVGGTVTPGPAQEEGDGDVKASNGRCCWTSLTLADDVRTSSCECHEDVVDDFRCRDDATRTRRRECTKGMPCRHDQDCVREWHELARVLDRLFFWILFIMMTLSAVFILLYPKYTGNEAGWIDSDD